MVFCGSGADRPDVLALHHVLAAADCGSVLPRLSLRPLLGLPRAAAYNHAEPLFYKLRRAAWLRPRRACDGPPGTSDAVKAAERC